MKHLYFILLLFVFTFNVSSQTNGCDNSPAGEISVGDTCSYTPMNSTNNTSYWDANTLTCGASQNDDVWVWFTGTGTSTTINYKNSDGDAIMHLFEGTPCSQTMTEVICIDNEVISNPETIVYPTITGTVYHVRVQNYGTDDSMNGEICASAITDGVTCPKALPFCTGTTENFPALTNVHDIDISAGPEKYGCLQAAPNPTWYHLKVGTAGNIAIEIESDCGDVDYAAWGPFPVLSCGSDLAGTYQHGLENGPGGANHAYETPHSLGNYNQPEGSMVDCAYSNASFEFLSIPNAQAGEYYTLMITNFDNCVGNITFSQTGGTGATDCSIVPLPIELILFEAIPTKSSVTLNWETASEFDNDYFTIERSIDGIDFKEIKRINGGGNSTQLQSYSYIDNTALRGLFYYRLKQTDFNGEYAYSSVVAADIKVENQIDVFPNPSKGKFSVQGKNITRIKVLSTDGFTVYNSSSKNIDLSDKPKGMYIVEITTDSSIQRVKIFIN